jgi:hypothetical protein
MHDDGRSPRNGTLRTEQIMTIPRMFTLAALAGVAAASAFAVEPAYFDVAKGSHPHDVAAAPAPGGPVYYTGQANGTLGILDPKSSRQEEVALGPGSAPHGVIVGPDGAPWITDGGQNAIVRVDPVTREVRSFPLPATAGYANLNTLTFDRKGRVWFTGQSGLYGKLDPATGEVKVWPVNLWHRDHARRRRLLRVTGRKLHCAHRHGIRRGHRDRTADARTRRAACMVGFTRPNLGELLEHRAGRPLRPGHAHVA